LFSYQSKIKLARKSSEFLLVLMCQYVGVKLSLTAGLNPLVTPHLGIGFLLLYLRGWHTVAPLFLGYYLGFMGEANAFVLASCYTLGASGLLASCQKLTGKIIQITTSGNLNKYIFCSLLIAALIQTFLLYLIPDRSSNWLQATLRDGIGIIAFTSVYLNLQHKYSLAPITEDKKRYLPLFGFVTLVVLISSWIDKPTLFIFFNMVTLPATLIIAICWQQTAVASALLLIACLSLWQGMDGIEVYTQANMGAFIGLLQAKFLLEVICTLNLAIITPKNSQAELSPCKT